MNLLKSWWNKILKILENRVLENREFVCHQVTQGFARWHETHELAARLAECGNWDTLLFVMNRERDACKKALADKKLVLDKRKFYSETLDFINILEIIIKFRSGLIGWFWL
jgi:hypothetical protein